MICRNCGTENEQGARFCTECGAAFAEETTTGAQENTENAGFASHQPGYENQDGAPYYQNNDACYRQQYAEGTQNYYGNTGYSQQPPYGGYYAPGTNDRIATVKDYLKWMLLYPLLSLIPCVGFIIFIVVCIKNAFDSSFKARANYFKALLIVDIIVIGAIILLCMILFPILAFMTDSVVTTMQDMDPSVFADGNFEYYFDMLIR